MSEYIFECNRCRKRRVMEAKDETATISHIGCGGIFEYSSPTPKPSEPKSIVLKPGKSIPVKSKSETKKSTHFDPGIETGQEYFHPKIDLIEKHRCPTCFKKKECQRTFLDKTWCLIKFMFELKSPKHEVEGGVLSKDPSEFGIIELDDKQKINTYDIVRLFINRDDKYSLQDIDNPDSFPDKNETLTYDILVKSLKGEITIGTRPVNPKNNTVKWIAWDIDLEHNENPKAVADALVKYLKGWYGLTGIIELSGSIDSYHVWVFLQAVDNKNAYEFDQNFRKRLKSIGIGADTKNIERGVQTGDSGMIKLPFNIQRKEKYGHKGSRSRFVDGVDLSKIMPERLPAPWGNPQSSETDITQQVIDEKTEPQINTSPAATDENIGHLNNILIEIIKNNEKVDGKLRCDKCPNENLVSQRHINEIITAIKNNKHAGCGGNGIFDIGIYETSIEILKPNTEFVRDFCTRLMESPKRKSEFFYEIKPTNSNFENTLVIKTIQEKDGKKLAGWLVNSAALKGKLHGPAPEPFKVEKVYFTIDFDKWSG